MAIVSSRIGIFRSRMGYTHLNGLGIILFSTNADIFSVTNSHISPLVHRDLLCCVFFRALCAVC